MIFHKTIVIVTGKQRDGIWLCVPYWNSNISVLRSIPSISTFSVGRRFFAQVNLSAEHADDLQFRDIEPK